MSIKHRQALKSLPCSLCHQTIEAKRPYYRNTATEPPRIYCEPCFTSGSSDYLMWVGTKNYPTVASFVEEASRMGACKRVPGVPADLKIGVTRVFLAHDEGESPTKEERATGVRSKGSIFGFFPVMAIRLVLDDPEKIAQYQEKLKGLELQVLSTDAARAEPERGCGYLVAGAVYLVSVIGSQSMDQVWEMAEPLAGATEVQGGIITFRNPIPILHIARFRGTMRIEPGLVPPLDDLGIRLGRYQIYTPLREVTVRP